MEEVSKMGRERWQSASWHPYDMSGGAQSTRGSSEPGPVAASRLHEASYKNLGVAKAQEATINYLRGRN